MANRLPEAPSSLWATGYLNFQILRLVNNNKYIPAVRLKTKFHFKLINCTPRKTPSGIYLTPANKSVFPIFAIIVVQKKTIILVYMEDL